MGYYTDRYSKSNVTKGCDALCNTAQNLAKNLGNIAQQVAGEMVRGHRRVQSAWEAPTPLTEEQKRNMREVYEETIKKNPLLAVDYNFDELV